MRVWVIWVLTASKENVQMKAKKMVLIAICLTTILVF